MPTKEANAANWDMVKSKILAGVVKATPLVATDSRIAFEDDIKQVLSVHGQSAKGQPPHQKSGKLRNSIKVSKNVSARTVELEVRGEAYGKVLNEKRDHNFMRPSVELLKKQLPGIIKAAFTDSLKRETK